MNDINKRLEAKIDKLDERLDSIDKTLVKQEENLKLHMYRTDQNEILIKKVFEELVPVKNHVSLMNNVAKIIVFIGIVVAIYKNLQP